ncbi:hypothetical protein PsorP6_002749 [Peronosclerospora sorghi]|uniref:Uncharacterized protein n=1 Tax=Peronosclerospora sorghi TaxID=230839 RepID=A0ACC0WV86_9STRA|nr:hypothetical protein PsorP6_002749 [Peronosclerospora sorghi]
MSYGHMYFVKTMLVNSGVSKSLDGVERVFKRFFELFTGRDIAIFKASNADIDTFVMDQVAHAVAMGYHSAERKVLQKWHRHIA